MKINEVKGKSLVRNQRAKNPNPSTTNNTEWRAYNNSNVSIEYVNDGVKATILNNGLGYSRGIVVNCTGIANTHKILAMITIKPSVTHDFKFETGNRTSELTSCAANQWTKLAGIVTSSKNDTQLIVNPATSNLSVNDTFTVRFASCIDLTQMFGAGNEPTTVEEVEAILDEDYYEYNTGEVVGNNVEKLDVTGFNMWDEEWEVGTISDDGTETTTANGVKSSNFCKCLSQTSYYVTYPSGTANTLYTCWYDSNKTYIKRSSIARGGGAITPPLNASYFKISIGGYGEYDNKFCINKSNTSKNGTYEPYKHSEFPLNLTELTGKVNGEGTSVTIFPDGLHGVGTAFDSLIVDEDGYARKAVKRIGSVDLGDKNWTYQSVGGVSLLYSNISIAHTVDNDHVNMMCSMYPVLPFSQRGASYPHIVFDGTVNKNIQVRSTEYTDATTFKTAMDGVMLYYELATPIEYVLDTPLQCVTKVYPNGTVKQVPVMPDSTPMVMDVTYLRDNALYATKEYVKDAIADKADSATTLAGYGITDAKIENGVITLGSNSVTPQTTSNLVTSVSSSSTDAQYPSAKCVYDLVGDIETLLASI